MLLAAASIILFPQPSLYFCVWNKAMEKVNDVLQKSAAFTFILKNIRNKQPTQIFFVFSSFETLNGLLPPSISPFHFKIHIFCVFTTTELSSLDRGHLQACQGITPQTHSAQKPWKILQES